MTLASRLSTEANLGHMDDSKEQWSMIIGNLTLVQVFYNERLHHYYMQVTKNPVTIKHIM